MIFVGIWMGLILGLGIGFALPEPNPEIICFKKDGKESCHEVIKK